MKLVLSLSEKKQVWALSNPEECRSYISYGKEKGVQKTILIFSGDDRGPKTIESDEYPPWAQRMIFSSVLIGDLINDGEPIGNNSLKEIAEIKDEVPEEPKPDKIEKIVVEKIKKTGKPKSGKTRTKKG